eukprot:CAMPEP_0176171390 /NCGR_PEP_ID=MMETSP0120_2-20121206/87737_1 /TAXON_ID=160619 /ORGANISM="Kryptoperidinium foliaceum, Strain CCMP 1326" /LENGTH=37 /DNA_ID= /DNA_START= /DNA_END= /DNA_ORIENTATION=
MTGQEILQDVQHFYVCIIGISGADRITKNSFQQATGK